MTRHHVALAAIAVLLALAVAGWIRERRWWRRLDEQAREHRRHLRAVPQPLKETS
jgi:positive regulator of sigma E activity